VRSLNTYAEIDLSALTHNLNAVKKKTRNKTILAVVKAGAYGHGAVRVSRHLLKNGVSMLGVAFTSEAIELREAGIRAPIVVFFSRESAETYLKYSLIPVVFSFRHAQAISRKACKHNRTVPVHIKVDTGMGRVGIRAEDALTDIHRIASLKNIEPEGLMSHLSDADMSDKEFAAVQIASFSRIIQALKEQGILFRYIHIANSAAVMRIPKAHFTMVRPGIMLYGYGPSQKGVLKPVMSLKSKIIFLKKVPRGTPISYGRTFVTKRDSIIATLPVGYADGYSRKLSNLGEVLIRGKRAPVVGRVCMDTIMADTSHIPHVREKDEAIIIGSQGRERITAQYIADKTGTIPYEVLTSVGERVTRVYRSKLS
jgi:alanine racemase